MKKYKKLILCLLLVFNMITNSGCWNYREIEDSVIVIAAAIDKNQDKYILTVEMIKPTPGFTKSEVQIVVFSEEGTTIFEAVRKLVKRSGRRPYWSNNMVLIFSKKIAQEGIAPAIDWFTRDSEQRSTAWVIISKNNDAKEIIIQSLTSKNRIIGMEINDAMKNQDILSRYPKIDLREFRKSISSDNISAVAPFIWVDEKDNKADIVVSGTAVFKGDKLIGNLDESETMAFLMIDEQGKKGVIVDGGIGEHNTSVTLEIFNIKKHLYFTEEEQRYNMRGYFEITVAIDEISGIDDVIDEKAREELIQKQEHDIKIRIEDLVKKVQKQYNSDIFGFGGIIEIQNPNFWKAIGEKSEGIFEKINFEAEVKIKIKGSGRQSKPIKVGK